MALSADSSILIAGFYPYLAKINSSNGAVLASYNSNASNSWYYMYIYARDTRALCIEINGWF